MLMGHERARRPRLVVSENIDRFESGMTRQDQSTATEMRFDSAPMSVS